MPALVGVTPDVFFDMTAVVKRARKNYFGIFDDPVDPVTKLDKTYVPLTEATVESIVKTVDLDTKDILILPKKEGDIVPVRFLRHIIRHYLDKMGFGQTLNDLLRAMVIDGTGIVKIGKVRERGLKEPRLTVKPVDRLNFFIDPTADSIQDAQAIIERSIFAPDDFENYRGVWKNIDEAKASEGVSRLALKGFSQASGSVPTKQIEVFERWGKGCKGCRLAFEDDSYSDHGAEAHSDEIEEQVKIASGHGGGNQATTCHFIGKNPNEENWKPYEEVWYRRMANRWDGRGVGEQIFGLQEYVNTIFNIRKNNALILQNGIFLVRKGSPITPQMVSSIYAGGTIPVSDIERDIKQLPVQDVRTSSYSDEDRGAIWADRVTGARRAEESIGASTPATIGIIQQQSVRDVFDLIQEGVGFFIERLLKRHLLPDILDDLDNDQIIRITGSSRELEELDNAVVQRMTDKARFDYLMQNGFLPEANDVALETQKAKNELKKLGSNRFLLYKRSAFNSDYDIDVIITSEKLDKAVMFQALRDILLAYARLPGSKLDPDLVLGEAMNILGIKIDVFRKSEEANPNPPALAAELNGQPAAPDRSPRLLQELPGTLPQQAQLASVANQLPNSGYGR